MDAVTQVPSPYNEPIRQYQPGSADRGALAATIKDLAGQRADLTMTVGGRQLMGSGERVPVVQPHNHQHVLGWFGNATEADVEAAIAAAGAAAKGARRSSCAPPTCSRGRGG
jgi:1-pyrroline-5-carboxylate dehydrogenase